MSRWLSPAFCSPSASPDAVPLAAFAAIAAIAFDRREGLAAIGAVWLANQAWGFAVMHYPMDAETFAWGAALGIIALLSCEAAGLTMRRLSGAVDACVAFLAAFLAYEGSLILIDLAPGQSADDFAAMTVLRIFLINACAFRGFYALRTVFTGVAFGRKAPKTLRRATSKHLAKERPVILPARRSSYNAGST